MSFGEFLSQLLGWLGQFIDWLLSFVPRVKIIQCNERGVWYVRGKPAEERRAGLRWYWPWCTHLAIHYISRCVLKVDSVAVETKDNVQLEIGAVITYRIADVVAWDCDNFNPEENMEEAAQAVLRGIVMGSTAEQLRAPAEEGSRLEQKFSKAMQRELSAFGVEVLKCRPNHQIRLSGAYRLFGATAVPAQEKI